MFKKEFIKRVFLYLALLEALSLFVFYFPSLRNIAFVSVCSLFLYLASKDFRYGAYLVLGELILGSKSGYLFSLSLDGKQLSIRIAFWLLLMSVWVIKFFIPVLLRKKNGRLFPIRYDWSKYFGVFFLFVLWGLVDGLLKGNGFANIFFDINGYFYYFLILPFFSLVSQNDKERNKRLYREIIDVMAAASLWISIKTLALLFLFSHRLEFVTRGLYSWVRSSGVGEITQMSGGFYRVFFQSHIFVMIMMVYFALMAVSRLSESRRNLKDLAKDRALRWLLVSLLVLCSTVIISMSRSNWVGLLVSILLALVYVVWRYRRRGLGNGLLLTCLIGLLGYAIVLALVRFPYPRPIGGFNAQDIFSDRASEFKEEAGVSSRWNLLPVLVSKIKEAPMLGSGYGATVTYISNDPRVRSVNPDGKYTTYAFEWGWLDIWIKLGLLGFVSYVSLLIALVLKYSKHGIAMAGDDQVLLVGLGIGLICLAAISFFSPYMNHPLGIGFILFSLLVNEAMLKSDNQETEKP